MKNRPYNIFFHLHTVSGIVISVLLYVIFFTGSFSFFRDEIVNWERNDPMVSSTEMHLNIDEALDTLATRYVLKGRDITFKKYYEEHQPAVSLGASKDTLIAEADRAGAFFYLHDEKFTEQSYPESYNLGEFLYRLHFFAQIPYPYGYYLSGFTAFFFLFALITGILIHWDKIVSNFYIFRPKAKLKVLWTDAHTALGTIGFPFQLVYAITGAFFMIQLLLVAPYAVVFFNKDKQELMQALEFTDPVYEYAGEDLGKPFSVEKYITETKQSWRDFNVTKIGVFNYADANMHVYVEGQLNPDSRFTGIGKVSYKVADGSATVIKNPYTGNSYLDGVKTAVYRLHYGDYAGYPLRIISFVMGIIGCVVILSGVLIWLNARNKKNTPEKEKRYNNSVANIYLSICLSMYPITALAFLVVKIKGGSGMSFLYWFYFIGWLLLSVLFMLKKNNTFTNKYTLLLGSFFGLMVPIVNGVMTGNWFWLALAENNIHSFFIDVFWLVLSLLTFYGFLKVKST
ncbi:PepSY-associated TM helix domain-containing protein [Neptunitalea lumnitzerae]|uniref:Aspartate kinase n=1 Tax=Neptunitalea lumnitzerae TaxID=2965509 RepID=A0ABQ5MGQ1_9FLAO|nr:PepSY-associated TM helix domain-containing protein [Neptunitalea sp. Y10]GLB48564.1 aspartate kinase [Neptunitalea sp. Y10]